MASYNNDQGDENTERLAQCGYVSLQQKVNDGNKACDDNYENCDTDIVGDNLTHCGDNYIAACEDDENGHTHTDAVEEHGGDSHSRAHAQKLYQNGVIGNKAVLELFLDIHFLTSLTQRSNGCDSRPNGGADSLGGDSCTGDSLNGAAVLGDLGVIGIQSGELISEEIVICLGAEAGGLGAGNDGDTVAGKVGIYADGDGDHALGAGYLGFNDPVAIVSLIDLLDCGLVAGVLDLVIGLKLHDLAVSLCGLLCLIFGSGPSSAMAARRSSSL